MHVLVTACLAAMAHANILTFDTLPVNAAGAWFGSGPMQAKYACSDPSTSSGLEECLSVLLAPNGWPDSYLKLGGSQSGNIVFLAAPTGGMGGMDDLVDGVAGSAWDGFLVATDFALPWAPTVSAIQMMLSQLIVSNGFSARIDDDGCLGPVNNTPGFDATTLAEKCPGVKNLTSGMYKYTFFAYQDSRGTDCDNCTLTFRNRIDVGIFTNITINSDQTLDTIGAAPVSKIRFEANSSMQLEIELPTLVTSGRKDSQKSDPSGATVTVTKITDTSFYLDFAMAAPGPDNIAFYDPAVTGSGPAGPGGSSVSAGLASGPLWALVAFLLSFLP
ncbi:unnamed protein product [Symbiodinium natans]|uniref:Uncharacterized protein n=1 Tax=Symbiodinium natans TaxID=878477 RepID=A0A812SAH4_9DINO|nr:unnamed protein product [Symbiodinium natans]